LCKAKWSESGKKVDQPASASPVTAVRQPFGTYSASLDEKGRLKLPAVFKEYLEKFSDKTLICTSLDGLIGQIYPISNWLQYQDFLDSNSEDPQAVEDVMFTAQKYGAEAEMDIQGRVTLNSDLRRKLGLEGQKLKLQAYRGGIQIMNEAMYAEKEQSAERNVVSAVDRLKKLGLGKGNR
jgi:MraZ protein